MVTEEQSRYNLKTASRNVAKRLNLDPQNLSHEERRSYNLGLAEEIQKYPNSFTPLALEIASKVKDQGALLDDGFDVFLFADSAVSQGESIVSQIKPLIYALIVLLILILVFPYVWKK